jgi:hypothetical protein
VHTRDHFFRIAAASITNCTYWAEKYTGCKDLDAILADEGMDSDDSDGSEKETTDDSDSQDDSQDDEPLVPKKKRRRHKLVDNSDDNS